VNYRGTNETEQCSLCKRNDTNLIGPFANKSNPEMKFWFHQECLIRNEYVIFEEPMTYENVGKCVTELVWAREKCK
jgi:hypothetical protein